MRDQTDMVVVAAEGVTEAVGADITNHFLDHVTDMVAAVVLVVADTKVRTKALEFSCYRVCLKSIMLRSFFPVFIASLSQYVKQ